jgi:hypothetical protein
MAKVILRGPMSGNVRSTIEIFDGVANLMSAKDRKRAMTMAMKRTCTRFAKAYLPKRFTDYVYGHGFRYSMRGGVKNPKPLVETGRTRRMTLWNYRIKVTGTSTKGVVGRVGWDVPEYISKNRVLRRVLDHAPASETDELVEYYADQLINAIQGATSRKLKSGRAVTRLGGA